MIRPLDGPDMCDPYQHHHNVTTLGDKLHCELIDRPGRLGDMFHDPAKCLLKAIMGSLLAGWPRKIPTRYSVLLERILSTIKVCSTDMIHGRVFRSGEKAIA
jgi:hypothetical protein